MLVSAAREDIEKYMDFAYSLAIDQTRSGYPLFSDGISTKEQFIEHTWKGFDGKGSEILLFCSDGKMEGWIQFFRIEEDHYLQTNGFLIAEHTEQALEEFIEYARECFAGFDLYLGFPGKNTKAITYLRNIGCELAEESYHDVFLFKDYTKQPEDPGLVKVTEENYPEFRSLCQTDENTYWNADRIYAALDQWTVYLLYRDGVAVGSVHAGNGEIFGLSYQDGRFDESAYKALVTKILNDCKRAGYESMTFLSDGESQPAALDLGFRCAGEYVLFIKSV